MALADVLKPQICQLGHIKIGGKNDRGYPEKHSYFTVTLMERANNDPKANLLPDEVLMSQLCAKYASKGDGRLRQLPIALLSNDLDDVLQASYVWYPGTRCGAVSDGVTLTWKYDTRTMQPLKDPITEPWNPETHLAMTWKVKDAVVPMFKVHCVLNCTIAAAEARWGGVYRFTTTSTISSNQLYGSLQTILQLTGGVLRGMPIWLVLRPVKVKQGVVYVAHAELRGPDLLEIQHNAMSRAKLEIEYRQETQRLALEYKRTVVAIGAESDAEQEAIAGEFHPEAAKAGDNGKPAFNPFFDTPPDKAGAPPMPEPTVDAEYEDIPEYEPTVMDRIEIACTEHQISPEELRGRLLPMTAAALKHEPTDADLTKLLERIQSGKLDSPGVREELYVRYDIPPTERT